MWNELLTPTLLPVQKSLEGEWLTHSHSVAYKKNKEGEWLIHSHTVAFTKEPRPERVNELLTPTLLPIQKSQEGKWLTHSHTVAYTKEPRGWITYSLPHSCLYNRAKRVNDLLTSTLLTIQKSQKDEWHSLPHCGLYKRVKSVNDLLTPTLLPIQKSKEGEWLTHSHNFASAQEPRVWMT